MAGSSASTRPAAARRGLEWLRRARADDRWRGFPTLAGESDVWVTSFVVAHLRQVGVRPAALTAARAYLARAQRPDGGWSYGGDVPTDADSTAWCLIALRGTRHLTPTAIRAATHVLTSHLTPDGTATYLDGVGIRRYIGANASTSIDGWTSPHPDVTAAALLADPSSLHIDAALALAGRLVARQSGAGFWDAYWWRGPLYTTALILRLLDAAGRRLPRDRAGRVLAALKREQLPDGGFALGASMEPDAFTTALALECFNRLGYLGGEDSRGAAAQSLSRQQHNDGSWTGDFVMRIPAPDVVDPRHVPAWRRGTGGGNSYVLDAGGIFATTLACYGLSLSERYDAADRERPELIVAEDRRDDDTVVTLSR